MHKPLSAVPAGVLIEAGAKRRLADEYDAAQERGEVARNGDNLPRVSKHNSKPTAADIGLTNQQIHEARAVRDAASRCVVEPLCR
jgi:hypothetical protein